MSPQIELSALITDINKIAQSILGDEASADVALNILKTLRTQFNAYGGVIYLYDEECKSLVTHAFSQNAYINSALKKILGSLDRYRFPIEAKNYISKSFRENVILRSTRLSDFFKEVLDARFVDNVQKILGVKLIVTVPIAVKEKVIGVLFVAFKRSTGLTQEAMDLLNFYANLSGIAIQNYQKNLELGNKYEMEKNTTIMFSHEIKTPIAIAFQEAQLMASNLAGATAENWQELVTKAKLNLEVMLKSLRRIEYASSSIFTLREVEGDFPAAVNVIDLDLHFAPIVKLFSKKAEEKKLSFHYHFKQKQERLYAALVQLEQVLIILLDNALKYTPAGFVEVTVVANSKTVKLTVIDSGLGIPAAQRQKIFERFYRYHSLMSRRVEGLGLGLYIAGKIVAKLNGKIDIQSGKLGKGTVFSVEIPVFKKLLVKNKILLTKQT